MNFRELQNHIGELIYIKSKPAYNTYKGVYILAGVSYAIEAGGESGLERIKTIRLSCMDRKSGSRIWINAESAYYTFNPEDNEELAQVLAEKRELKKYIMR